MLKRSHWAGMNAWQMLWEDFYLLSILFIWMWVFLSHSLRHKNNYQDWLLAPSFHSTKVHVLSCNGKSNGSNVASWNSTLISSSTWPSMWTHRAMFNLGATNLLVLCLLVKNMSAVYSADRCDFLNVWTACSRNGNNFYKGSIERTLNSEQFGHFRFSNHHCNW